MPIHVWIDDANSGVQLRWCNKTLCSTPFDFCCTVFHFAAATAHSIAEAKIALIFVIYLELFKKKLHNQLHC